MSAPFGAQCAVVGFSRARLCSYTQHPPENTIDLQTCMLSPRSSIFSAPPSLLVPQVDLFGLMQDYNFSILHGTVTVSSWRQLLFWVGVPGLAIAALALLTLDEPRKPSGNVLGDVFSSSKFTSSTTRDLSRSQKDSFETAKKSAKAKADAAKKEEEEKESFWSSVKELVGSPVFQV